MVQPDAAPSAPIVARSKQMQRVMALVEKIAAWDVNLCLVGEAGTGKERLARAIHQGSPRRGRPFVTLDGTRMGASGADADSGIMAKAETGTLFVDELVTLSPHLQAALLALIQSRQPVRGRGDVRLIAGTTANLTSAIDAGAVRADLYYRAAAILLHVPPLRERRDDLPFIVEQLLQRLARAQGKVAKQLSPRAVTFVLNFEWPGNDHQLERALEQAVKVTTKDVIDLEVLETACRLAAAPGGLRSSA